MLSESTLIFLKRIYEFIDTNIEVNKLLNKQKLFFKEYNLSNRCTLKGITEIEPTEGDKILIHLISIITEFLKYNITQESKDDVAFELDSGALHSNLVLQTKRIPFKDLQLSIIKEPARKLKNQIGMSKQRLIVCASLVDKATNIAGIARTCEIFAVEKLLISDIQVTKTDIFQSISVSSDSWLDIEQLHIKDMASYLKLCKIQGYEIVGLEQTEDSISLLQISELYKNKFPSQMVLVLGREKEGIPVDILQIIDRCIEIPQYGVTRSLNVHVSAALAIWEITKVYFPNC